MKLSIKKVLFILLTLLAITTTSVLAAGQVIYDGDAQEFIFIPGTGSTGTDLFGGFKNMMPGDKRTQQVLIKNPADKMVDIEIFMKSTGSMVGSEDFLNQFKLKVTASSGTIELFEGPADQSVQLTDWVYLGKINSGGEVVLDVECELPITAGNIANDGIGYLQWHFKIEAYDVPHTGDNYNFTLLYGVMGLSLAAIAGVVYLKKKVLKD
ncbi:MAG: LPXTG cell wall anchor domain-containing protein [Erysipelotrichaceae bacterium]|jgi:LPXTG-motif cell wall-anchored protein